MTQPRKSFKTEKGTELPLMSLKGKEYLQVAHRLVWLDEKYPHYTLQSDFIKLTDTEAIVRSTIKIMDETGKVIREATATKREEKKDFADFIEKAETGSYGRALAMLGIGTQFAAPDLDEIENENGVQVNRLADSPTTAAIKPTATEAVKEKPIIEEKRRGFSRPKPTPEQELQYKVITSTTKTENEDDAWN